MQKRKHDESFLQFGFSFKSCYGYKKPLCLICNELFATESLKPSKLKRHLDLNHASCVNKPKNILKDC